MKDKQVVVQEAPEMIRCRFASYASSLIPWMLVTVSSGIDSDLSLILKGAERMTFLAPATR